MGPTKKNVVYYGKNYGVPTKIFRLCGVKEAPKPSNPNISAQDKRKMYET